MATALEEVQQALNKAVWMYSYALENFGADSPQAASALDNVNRAQAIVDHTYAALTSPPTVVTTQPPPVVTPPPPPQPPPVVTPPPPPQPPPTPPPVVLTTGAANNLIYRSMTSGAPTSEFDKYGGYQAVKNASTLDATPKGIAEYERAMGLPESEYTRANKQYAESGKTKDTIVSEIKALIPPSGSISYESIVKYANNNNLSFEAVSNALEGVFKDVTKAQILDSLAYEDDRLILNSLAKTKTVNGKETTTVDLIDAIRAASQGEVSPENVAKFFGKTASEMSSLVSTNLDFIADNLRDYGVDPSKSLSSMFGIDANKVTQSIKTTDIKEGLSGLAGTDGKISYEAALNFAKTKGLTNDELAGYLGVTPQAITDYIKTSDISKGLSALAGTDGKIDIGQAIIYARNNKLSDAELAGYLGVTPETISNYITNRQTTARLEDAAGEDKKLSYSEILNFAEANNLSLEKVAEYITGPEGRAELVKNINEYKLDNQLRTNYEDAATLLQNAVRTFGSGSPQVEAAFDNFLNAKKDYFTSPNLGALRKAFSDAYKEYTGLSSEVSDREFDRFYEPGMTLQQLWDIAVTPRQQTVTTPPASGTDQSGAASTVNQQTSTTIKTEAPSTVVRYDDPIYISAFASGTLNRTDISDQEKASILNSFADDNNISRESLARATGYSLNDINTFLGHTPKSIAADLRNISDRDGSITYDKILEYSATKNIPLEDIASAINTSADALTKYKTDKAITTGLQAASGSDGNLSYDELFKFADESGTSLEDIARLTNLPISDLNTYKSQKLLNDKIQEAAGTDNILTYDEILNYADKNNISLFDAAAATKVPLESLTKYKTDKAITTGLQAAPGEDKTLSYDEIINYASTNNLNLSDVVNYIGTEDKRADLLSGLQSYVQDKEFTSGLSGSTVTDHTGKQYAASDLLSLAKQIKSNFDLNNSSGSVYQTQGANIGFAYEEAAKLFPNGNPTVLDQVTVDMARNLLNQGISSVEELSKYKPTQVTEQAPNPEGGGNLETVVTKYIDPETGKELSLDGFGAAYAGEGGTIYNARIDASGKPVFGTVFTDTSDRQQIGALVTFAAAVFAPQILPNLIGSSVSGIELAALGGEMAAGTGLTGALIGAGVPASVAGYAATAIVNGVYNGVVTEVNGGDFTKGFISGGVAPVIGQIATNAVNSITTGLPTGVSNAVGNAVTQLISTGEIDLGQMALAGVKPSAINTIVEASGGALTAPQARLLFETVASGGQNIISLAQNPGAVVNFVMRNQDVFNNTATAAVTGTSQKPAAVDVAPLDPVQKELLVNNTRVETPQGQSLFQDINTTELGKDIQTGALVSGLDTSLGAPVSGLDYAPGITGPTDEFANFDAAIKYANDLTAYRDALRTGSLDFQGYDQARLEATLINMQPTLERARDAAETLYGKGASFTFDGKFYEGDLGKTVLTDAKGNQYTISKEATLITDKQGGVIGYTLNGKNYDYRGNEMPADGAVPKVTQIKDSQGNTFNVPANATLNKNASGSIIGYTVDGKTFEYENGKMVPKVTAQPTEVYTGDSLRSLSLTQLHDAYKSANPDADKQTVIPGTGQVTTPYQQWLMRYAANPDMAANELNKPAVKQQASFLQQVAQNVGAVVADLRASDNSYVRSVGDKLATNASQLGELAKGLTTTLTSPVELFNAIAFGDPNNPLSKWASSVRSDVTAAQAAVDPEWQKTKAYLNEQLTNIGADRGQIDQAIATIDMYANNPRAIGDLIANTIPTIIPGLGAYTALRTVGAGATAAYMGGAFTAATTSQTDLIEMADRTYENILKQVKAENPSLTESEAQVKAAAGAAMSMRGAGIISLAGSTALQLLPGSQLNNVLVKAVTREIGQEVGDELWVKAISNAWQGKPLQADMGRTTIEAVVASGPIAGAAQLLSTQTGNTYNQDNVIRDLTWEVVEGKPTFDKGVKLLTGPNNEVIYNSANQPILLTYTEKPGLTLETDPDASGPSPMDRNVSDPAESLFDIIFDNETNGGYYVNSVDLDGNSYTVTDRDGVTQVINTDSLLNKALDVITQNNPQEVTYANPIEQLLTDAFARSINLEAATGAQTTGNIVAVNPKGAFVNTRSGDIVFVPTTQTNQTVTLSNLKYGDSVVLGNGYVAPITKEVNTNGQESIVLDGSRLNTNLGVSFVTAANPATVTFQNLTGQELTIDRTQLPAGINYETGSLVYTNTLPFVFDQTSGLAKDSLQITPSPINLTPGTGFDFSPGPIDLTTGSIPSSVPGLVPSLIPAPTPPVVTPPAPTPYPTPPVVTPPAPTPYPTPSVLTPPVTPPPVDQPPIITNTPSTPPVVNPPGLVPPTPPTVPVTTIQPPPAPPATFTPPVELMPPSGLTPPDIPLSGAPSTTINVGGSPTIKVPPVGATRPPPVTIVPTGGTPTTPPTWGYPNIPPPELPPYEPMPYPNYLRPLTPYLPLGIGALMEAMYAQEQGNGRYQPIQNAGGYFKIPT